MSYTQPSNPTDEERDMMIRLTLEAVDRIEDFNNIKELLSPPNDITKIISPDKRQNIKIGIIGAGLAGLSSAFELRKIGFDITIFEMQKERIGGRVYTHYFDKKNDLYGELGAMRIPVSNETTWHYINLFKLETKPFIQMNNNGIIYVRNKHAKNDQRGISIMKNIYPEFNLSQYEKDKSWQEILSYALETELEKLEPSIRREILLAKKEYSKEIRDLGSISIRKVLERKGVSEGAIELLSCINPFLGNFYYNSYIENLQEQYSIDYAYRYYIEGGLSNLPISFYKSLKSKNPKEYYNIENSNLGNINFKLGTKAIGICKTNEKDKVRIIYRNGKDSEIYNDDFDYIICAIPFSSLRNVQIKPMFTTGKMQAIKELSYVYAQKTVFLCNNRFWEAGNEKEKIIGGSSSTDQVISSIWYPSNPTVINQKKHSNKKYKKANNPGVILASYNLNNDAVRLGNEKKHVEQVKRQIEAVHSLKCGYLDSVVEDYKLIQWDHEEGFYGSFVYYMPEQQERFAYVSERPEYDGRVYFAGEHISQTHAWMQGALNSGMKAANKIAEHYKYKLSI